jgi:hypothetical protein
VVESEALPSSRYRDPGQSIDDFLDEILVVCPACGGCARTFRKDADRKDLFATRRLVCLACGASKERAGREIAHARRGAPRDGYFGLALWLQTPCAGHTLWAYNRRHLEAVEAFIAARHRERVHDEKVGWQNRSLGSRLPKWLQSAKRPVVLQAIARLKGKLSGDGD